MAQRPKKSTKSVPLDLPVSAKARVPRDRPTGARPRLIRAVSSPRFRVPDLSPRDRPALGDVLPRFAFVAESPHVNEIAPEREPDRRPLCGAAGKTWWKALSAILETTASDDVSLERLLAFCRRHGIAVLNAVQFPLDPKVARANPEAEPVKNLGFSKGPGEHSYKKRKDSEAMRWHIESLRERLEHPTLAGAKIYCLGNDAQWFVERALGKDSPARIAGKIPHPSAWWRSGGAFERIALAKLTEIFGSSRANR